MKKQTKLKIYPVHNPLNPAPLSTISLKILTVGTPLSNPHPCSFLPSWINWPLTLINSQGAVRKFEINPIKTE